MPGKLPGSDVTPPSRPGASGSAAGGGQFNEDMLGWLVQADPSTPASAPQLSPADAALWANQLDEVSRRALGLWESALGWLPRIGIEVVWTDLPAGQIGLSVITSSGARGETLTGRVLLDRDADGFGWWWGGEGDAETWTVSSSGVLTAVAGSAAAERIDLLTVLTHEFGHLLGFNSSFGGFAANTTVRRDGSSYYTAEGGPYTLTSDRSHLDSAAHPWDLMNATLRPGERKLPSAANVAMLRVAWMGASGGTAATGGGVKLFYIHADTFALPEGGFVLLADALAERLKGEVPTGLQDGGFTAPDNPAWDTIGAVEFQGGKVILGEDPALLFSTLAQVFRLPAGAKFLEFTLSGLVLNGGGATPPDAFEISLLHAGTLAPMAGILSGLGGSDALLNIQPGGTIFAAEAVSVTGSPTDGQFVVRIDLAGIPAGTPLLLTFDLIRFGAVGSAVTIESAVVIGEVSPQRTPPVVTGGGEVTVRQGDPFAAPGAFTDAGGADVWTGVVDFGDGTEPRVLPLNGQNFILEHIFRRAGIWTVTVSITDSNGDTGTATWQVTVENVPPVVAPVADRSGRTGQTVSISTSFTDPGDDIFTAVIDWGDGTTTPVTVDATGRLISGEHVYQTPGVFHATLRLSDGIAEVLTPFVITVTADVTVAAVSGPSSVMEGSAYVLELAVTGPRAGAITSWTIDWGDGTVSVLQGNPRLAAHVYGKGASTYAITAFASDGVTNFGANALTVDVLNSPPRVVRVARGGSVAEGTPVRIDVMFDDRGSSDEHQVEVDWGDGTTSTFTLAPGVRRFELVHIYADNRPDGLPYEIRFTLTDVGREMTGGETSVTIFNVAPIVNLNGPVRVEAGRQARFAGVARDPGVRDPVEVSWVFGDAKPLPFADAFDDANLNRSWIFSEPGIYTVTLLARDGEGALAQSTVTIEVVLAPVLPPGLEGGRPDGPAAPAPGLGDGSAVVFRSARELVSALEASQDGGYLPAFEEASALNLHARAAIDELGLEAWNDSLFALVERGYASGGALLQVVDWNAEFVDGNMLVVTLRFSADVGDTLAREDLIVSLDGVPVDLGLAEFQYDAATRTAVWRIHAAPAASIKLELPAHAVSAKGQQLDGDGDGVPGGLFLREKAAASAQEIETEEEKEETTPPDPSEPAAVPAQ